MELLKIHDSAIDEPRKMQFVDKKYSDEEKKALRDNLENIG